MDKENKGTNIKSNIKPVTKNMKLVNTKSLQSKATASQNSAKSIKKMEPDVNLVEKQTDKVLKKILFLEGVG